jgi:hypothetical protein
VDALSLCHYYPQILAKTLLCFNAFGDGAFFKRGAMEAPPAIPAQHALITFRDGVETLVVESTVENDGSELAWIIPVPAKPTRYEALEPGFIDTLRVYVGSRVVEGWVRSDLMGFFLLGLFWLLSFKLFPRPYTRGSWFFIVVYVIVCLVVITMFALGGVRGPGAPAPPPGVKVLEAQRVGQYDVALLEAAEAGAVQAWLDAEGFGALPPEAVSIVQGYVAQGWLFVAARLTPDAPELLRPHPIAITFPADAPVYPMRLTGLAGHPVYLELFVVTEDTTPQAQKPLTLHYSRKVYQREDMKEVLCAEQALQEPPYDMWRTFRLGGPVRLDHPDGGRFLWDGAVLTKLAGAFEPEDMRRDVVLESRPYTEFIREVYAPSAAKARRTLLGILALGYVWLILDIVFWRRKQRGVRRYAARVAMPAVVAGAVAWAVGYVHWPVGEPRERPAHDRPQALRWDYVKRFVERQHPEAWEDPELMRSLLAQEAAWLINPIQGGPLREEASPGNYKVYDGPCGVYVIAFFDGGPMLALHPPDYEPDVVTVGQSP